jgi:hypothetical protein
VNIKPTNKPYNTQIVYITHSLRENTYIAYIRQSKDARNKPSEGTIRNKRVQGAVHIWRLREAKRMCHHFGVDHSFRHLREKSGCNIKSTQYAQEEPSSWAIRSPPSLESAKMSSTVAITLSTISIYQMDKPPIPQLRPRCKPVAVKEGNPWQHPKGINADPSTSTETKAKAKKVKRLVNLGWKPGQKGDASGERSRNTYIHT